VKRLAIGLLAALALSACGHHSTNVTTQSAGADQAAGGTAIVASGTNYFGKLEQPVSTKTSKDGDTFSIDETKSKNPALAGAVIDGHLAGIVAAGPMRSPKITIVFDDIRLADGTKQPVNVQLVDVGAFSPKTHHMRTLGMMIGGAVAGHMLARRTGRHHGALLGAASAYALSQTLKTDIYVPAGSTIELRFASPVTSAASPAASNT
jgi:hypothetical protein